MNKLLKRLTVLSLLLLFLPFCQMCSDEEILSNSWLRNYPLDEEVNAFIVTDSIITEMESNAQDTVDVKEFHLTYEELKQKKITAIRRFKESQRELTYSGYGLAYIPLPDFDWSDFMLTCTLAVLLCVFQVYLSFTRKYRAILILSCVNIVLLLIPIVVGYCSEVLEDINQIKCGCYLFFANTILIIYLSYKLHKERRTYNNEAYEKTDI